MTLILPVIHHRDDRTSMANAEIAAGAGCQGLFLIEMSGRDALLKDVACRIKDRWPALRVGINNLGMSCLQSIESNVDLGMDMTWADSCGVSAGMIQPGTTVPENFLFDAAVLMDPNHLLFAGVAFKYQVRDPDPLASARFVADRGWIVTTSGEATGKAPDVEKIRAMKAAIGDRSLAAASGITAENMRLYRENLDYALVSTGISEDEHRFSAPRLDALMLQA